MGINDIVIYIMVIFMVIGAIDKLLGNKFGYGEKFEEGLLAMGALGLAMIGIIVLSPVISAVLEPIIIPASNLVGNDPSVFAGMILANDMGGYVLAQTLTTDTQAAMFSGLILGSMFGPTIVFTIPVALGIIKKDDHEYLAKGVLAGLVTIPLGVLVGGLVGGFDILFILINLIPVIIVSVLIIIGLKFKPEMVVNGFKFFGKGIVILATFGLVVGIIQELTDVVILKNAVEIKEGIEVVGLIAIVLAGAFPMVHFITTTFSKQLASIGKKLGMNDVGAAGLIATLANNITMFGMLKDMNHRGKLINVAFAVSASFVLGDHLGFTASVESSMILPMIVGKIVAGCTAVVVIMMMDGKSGTKSKEVKK